MSRNSANRIRKSVISENGEKVADKKQIKRIKEYCRESFGSSAYWPWLALYTELRGEFKKGWIPDDYYRFELLPKLNPEKYMRFSEAKCIDRKLFKNLIIKPLFYRSYGQFIDKNGIIKSKSAIKKLLNKLDQEIIIKPEAGRGGQGIIFKQSQNLDLEALPTEENFVFHKVLKQHPELHGLYPHSINTIRVSTHLKYNGNVNVLSTILRFGMGGSRIDNASSGGGCIYIHATGKIEQEAYNDFGFSLGAKHPDTGIKFKDLELRYFNDVIALCKEAHSTFPYVKIIGWDVYINENAEPMLIEWNANNPGIWTQEALYGPFLKDLTID